MDIALARLDAVGQHRSQTRHETLRLGTQRIARDHVGQPRNGTNLPGHDLTCGLQAYPHAHPHLVNLLLPALHAAHALQHVARMERAAGHLQPRDALAAPTMAHLVHACRKGLGPLALPRESLQPVEQLINAFQMQGRTTHARHDLTLGHQPLPGRDAQAAGLQQLVQCCLVGHGHSLVAVGVTQRAHVYAARRESLLQLREHRRAVRPGQVHLVHEDEGGNTPLFQQAPHRRRVSLHAIACTYHEHSAVQRL